jgi:hypothetical protein
MTLHWWFLTPAIIFTAIGLILFLVRRRERETGHVIFWIGTPVSWSREDHPGHFKFRQTGLWIPIGIFALASVGFFLQFLGLVR